MTNTLPVLTEVRRRSLIEWAEGYIEAAERSVENNPLDVSAKAYLELLQISYAALTTEPADFTNEENWDKPLYVYPPVPVLKLPDEKPVIDKEDGNDIDYMEPIDIYDLGKVDGFNKAIAEAKRLNGVTE